MITDVRGRELRFEEPPRRVVSLVPSLTETLYELGAEESIVGVTDFCIFPSRIERPRVGGTKNPNVSLIRDLRPDLVHMNLEENLKRHADQLESFTQIFVTEPKSVADVRTLITTLGDLHGRGRRAAELTRDLGDAVAALPKRSFRFACAIWKKPWMWCGGDTYISALVEEAGGENVLRHRARYPEMDLDCLASLEPQIVFLPDEPYVFTSGDADEIREVVGGHVVGPFPGHLFTWHGTRTIEGLRFLRAVLDANATV